MNWLITGGCGFLGTSLIKHLATEGGHKIRVIDNLSVGTRDDLAAVSGFIELNPSELAGIIPSPTQGEGWGEGAEVQLIVGDILDEALALSVAKGAEVIVHLAANTGVGPSVENPRLDCVTNVIGTFNYLESARHSKVKRFIFASSGAPIGECEPPIHEEKVPHPVSPYGASKLAGEGYCSAYFRTFGIETVALRFGNVYGPGSGHKNSVIAKFIKQILDGETLEIYGDGKQTRDFIFIDDLVNAVCLATTKAEDGGEIFQIATNAETTVSGILKLLIAEFDKRGVRGITHVNSTPRIGDVMRNFSDTAKAKRMLGWKPKISLNIGIGLTLDYFMSK